MAKKIEELERALAPFENEKMMAQRMPEGVESRPSLPVAISGGSTIDQRNGNNTPDIQQFSPDFQSTSAVQEPHRNDSVEEISLPIRDPNLPTMTTTQLALWHSRAVEACSLQQGLLSKQIDHLFKTYWTWVFPAFLFVSRPHFLRDTSVGGPYSSPLLCSVICLQATRFTNHMLGQELISHVRFLLGQEIHRGPSIPLVQALLQLSARELGNGSLHQSWLYSGMAFRLATDMGIFTRPPKSAMDATENHIRGQLAWSCYLWDKAISLYLGRVPSLPERPDSEPVVLDDQIEAEIWVPYVRASSDPTNDMSNNSNTLHPVQTYGITCFSNFCKLGTIIHDILATMYAKKPNSDMLAFVQQTRHRLEHWRCETPIHLKTLPGSQICPPAHIISQK